MNLFGRFLRYVTFLLSIGGVVAFTAVMRQLNAADQQRPASTHQSVPVKAAADDIAGTGLLEANGEVGGFDTGPGNVLIDLWCQRNTGRPFDDSGAWARTGKVDDMLLGILLADPFFARPAPKSTGRDLFNARWLAERLEQFVAAQDLPPEDIQATLLELTARSIVNSAADSAIDALFVCGGGARNDYLMERLRTLLGGKPVESTNAIGVPPDWVEAVAFAWFALQTLNGTPANLPRVTGARGLRMLGAIYPA